MKFWKRSIRQDDRSHRDFTRARGPSRKRRLQLENLEERALLSTYTLFEFYSSGVPYVVETVDSITTFYSNPVSPFVVTTSGGGNTVNILDTSARIGITVEDGGNDVINVGDSGSVQGIRGDVAVMSTDLMQSHNCVLNIDDSADATARTVTLEATFATGGQDGVSISGLAPASIGYGNIDVSSLNLTTGSAADTVNVLDTDVTTNLSTSGGNDVVNVGNHGIAWDIHGTLNIRNPKGGSTLNISNAEGISSQTVTLSSFTSGDSSWDSITGLADAAINYEHGCTNNVNITTDPLGSTINVRTTYADTSIVSLGADTINVGDSGSVQGIRGTLNIENPPHRDTIKVDDSADATARIVTLGTFVNPRDSQGNSDPWGAISGLAPADIFYEYADTAGVTIDTGTGGNTINVRATGAATSIVSAGHDTVNVGDSGSVQGIFGALNVENPPSYTTLNVDDSADAAARTVTLGTFVNPADSQGNSDQWGKISGLAPADINYEYADTSSPVNISTVVDCVSWNVSADAMAGVTGVVVNDNGFAINSLPANPAAATAYSPVSGSLFGANGPSYLDVQQGDLGDCWLLASLAEVAARDPQDIRNMFTYDGTIVDNGATVGLYTVRFFDRTSGSADYVQVDTELPSAGGYYDHPANGVLWVALAEKAYAEANGAGMVTTFDVGSDSYDALDPSQNGRHEGGYPAWALQATTGKPASMFTINPANIAAAWNAGQLIVLGSSPNAGDNLIVGDSNGTHAYAVVGYDPSSSEPFELYNPWGLSSVLGHTTTFNGGQVYDGPFLCDSSLISQDFASQTIGSGTAAGPDVHGNSSQAGAASANSGSAISVSTHSSAQEPLLIALAPTSFSQSIGRQHDHLDRALGSLMEDDLAFLRS